MALSITDGKYKQNNTPINNLFLLINGSFIHCVQMLPPLIYFKRAAC